MTLTYLFSRIVPVRSPGPHLEDIDSAAVAFHFANLLGAALADYRIGNVFPSGRVIIWVKQTTRLHYRTNGTCGCCENRGEMQSALIGEDFCLPSEW